MILTLHSSMHTQIHAEAGDNGKGVTRSNVHPLTPREGEGEERRERECMQLYDSVLEQALSYCTSVVANVIPLG